MTNLPLLPQDKPAAPAKLDPALGLGRIDLIATLIVVLSICVLGLMAVAKAFIELARIIFSLWADSFDRWLVVILGLALLWLVARWKKLSVF
jgi:hypothetical protein